MANKIKNLSEMDSLVNRNPENVFLAVKTVFLRIGFVPECHQDSRKTVQ